MGFENFGKKLSTMASVAAKKTNEQVQIAKLNLDKAGLEKDIDGVYLAMGKYNYAAYKNGIAVSSDLLDYCAEIDKLKAEIALLTEQIAKVKESDDDVGQTYTEVPVEPVDPASHPAE